MPKVDVCEHWIGYSIPNDAAICPGCGRRHPVHIPPPSAMVSAVLAATGATPAAPARPAARVPRRDAPLDRFARVTRWLVALSAWALAAFGAAATARYVLGLDEVADEVAEDLPARVGEIAHGIGLAAVALLVLAVAGAITWSRRAHPVSRVGLHSWTLWLAVPAAGLLAAALAGGSDELHDERALLGLAGAVLAIVSARTLYDVVGLVPVAPAHPAETAEPWTDEDDGWADDGSEPLRR